MYTTSSDNENLDSAKVFENSGGGRDGRSFCACPNSRLTRPLDLPFRHEPVPAKFGPIAQAETPSLEASRLRDGFLPWGDAGRGPEHRRSGSLVSSGTEGVARHLLRPALVRRRRPHAFTGAAEERLDVLPDCPSSR